MREARWVHEDHTGGVVVCSLVEIIGRWRCRLERLHLGNDPSADPNARGRQALSHLSPSGIFQTRQHFEASHLGWEGSPSLFESIGLAALTTG